jgi:multidrug efflux pump subunit AcrB
MAFIAFMLIGISTTSNLAVSLMPDVEIPVISIRIPQVEMPARQLENAVVRKIRNVLKEVNNIEEIKSESRDGSAWIELRFKHGASIHLASIEVNEKIDKAMNYLPRELKRPEVIRASASDIPVFYLMIYKKKAFVNGNKDEFLDLSNFSSQVIRKRLEQLPEVALVDMSGLQQPEIKITPKQAYLKNGSLSIADIEQTLANNNIDLGNLLIRDGQYQYNIRFNTKLQDVSDIAILPINLNGKIVDLATVADISLQAQEPHGNIKYNHQDALSLAVIKQSDAQISSLKEELNKLIHHFKTDYPELEFKISRDQSMLLEYSINNLSQSLIIGGILAFAVMFLFLKERKAPWLIGISIPVSLLLSLFFFYLFGLTINIISLSGLILGVGMMIDNSIIVIDNITQHRQNRALLDQVCISGTNEVISPLISSVLTTCAVFIPLIFMKGMAGSLFFDQAIAITIGLSISLIVSIVLLPTLYRLIHLNNTPNQPSNNSMAGYFRWYEKGLRFVLRHQFASLLMVLALVGSALFLTHYLDVSKFPKVSQDATILQIDWNQAITLKENNKRTKTLLSSLQTDSITIIEEAGEQQYLINKDNNAGSSQNTIFLKAHSTAALFDVIKEIKENLDNNYPEADYAFKESQNLFNLTFGGTDAPLIACLTHINPNSQNYLTDLRSLLGELDKAYSDEIESKLISRKIMLLESNPEKLLFYGIDHEQLYREIKSAFNVITVFSINGNNIYVPVNIGNNYQSVYEIIKNSSIPNKNKQKIPLSGLIKISNTIGLKNIVAGKENEYFPLGFSIDNDDLEEVTQQVKETVSRHDAFNVYFKGALLSDRQMLKQLTLIIGLSLLLLYFILAAQFESFTLPFIVLLEVPIDLFGAFVALKLYGAGLNIMSAIGIIVMSGIIINDSILKIDTINKLIQNGHSLLRAILMAGHKRLKPIIMTSLTTILAMLPFLFQKGLGAELQQPLALAVIGGMTLGTLVSLYFIPLMYYLLYKNKKQFQTN